MKRTLLLLMMAITTWSFSQNKNRALIIGISDYKELPKGLQLQYADDDAMEFYNFILSNAIGNIDSTDVKLLLNDEATAAQIYSALDELIEVSKPNDKIIIYFSGHGDIETKTVRQRGFLLAHDSPRAGYQVGGTVKLSDLQDYLETLVVTNKARVILITDACRSGKLAGGEAGASQTTAALHEQWASITKILSSQAGELSAESNAWGTGHGVFTYNLIHGLWGLADTDKDGWVSFNELNIYLSQEVPKATFNSQHPMVYGGNLGSKMSRVDKVKVAEIIAKTNSNNLDASMLLASNKGSFTNLDTMSKRLYNNFKSAVDRGDLLLPKKKNAVELYRQLNNLNAQNIPFINEMKRVMVAKIEDEVQTTLNRYMVHDKTLTDKDYRLASEKMDLALTLIPSNYPRFNSITAKKLFLKANLLECICDPKAVSDKKAMQSLAILKKAIALDPDVAYLYNSLGSAYFFLEKYDSAMASYKQASQLAPSWLYPISNLGTAYLTKEDYLNPVDIDSAIEKYRKVIRLDSGYSYGYYDLYRGLYSKSEWGLAYYYKAVSYYLEDDEKQFWKDLEVATSFGYDISSSSFFKYNSSKNSGELLINLPEYTALLGKYDKEQAQVTIADSYFDLAQTNLKNKKYDKAIEYFNKANENWPEEFGKRYSGLSDAYAFKNDKARSAYYKAKGYQQEYDQEKAIENYQLAISLNPNLTESFIALGDLYDESGSTEEAIQNYEKAVALNPNWTEGLIRLGGAYTDQGDYKKATEYYEHAVALDPKRADGFERLGYLYKKDNQFGKAIENYEKSIQLDTSSFENFIQLGKLYKGNMDYEKAIKSFQKAINLDSTSSTGFVHLAEFYQGQRDYEKAVKNYNKATALNPTATESQIKLGDMYRDKKDYALAIQSYQKAVVANPKETNSIFKLGVLYFYYMGSKFYDKALEQYSKAIAKDTTWAYYNIGLVYLEMKDYNKAIESFLIVIKHYKGHQLYLSKNSYMTNYGSPYFKLSSAYAGQGNQQLLNLYNAKGYLVEGAIEKSLEWIELAAKSGYDISSDSFFNEELKDSEEFKNLVKKYPKKN